MWAEERSHRILTLLSAQGRLETDGLAETLNVSRETIRRDLLKLEAEGKVRRVHGGVVPAELPPEKPFAMRRQVNAAEKQRIAKAAVRLLEPGECCFIDAGTTTEAFAAELTRLPGIAVITNSLVGLHPEHGATDYFLPEAEVARAMISNAGRLIMLADRSKLGEVSRVQLCACVAIDALVVDKGGHALLAASKKAGVRTIVEA